MARHHCGAENADAAKFCSGCGEKLQAAAPVTGSATEVSCPACGVANKPGTKFCGKCGAGMVAPAATPAGFEAPVQAPAPAESPAESPAPAHIATAADIPEVSAAARKTAAEAPAASNRTGVIVLAGALLVAVLAGAGWLAFGSGTAADAPDVAQQSPAQEAEKSPEKPAATRTAASTAPAAQPDRAPQEPAQAGRAAASAAPQSDEDKAQRRREERAARRAEQEERRAEQEERRAAESARREAAARETAARNEALAKRAPQPAADNSIQQKCSTARNEFSRSLCETRECSRPEKYDTPYCVAFRKRYHQEDSQQF